MVEVRVIPVPGLPEIRPGDDLAGLLVPLLRERGLEGGDVVCVSSKVVSKALGLLVPASRREDALAAATVRMVARRRHGSVVTSVVAARSGPVLAAAGLDSSNSPDGVLMLPDDPDAEAVALRRRLEEALSVRIGVILTDTSSRVWRTGVGDIALGADGVRVLEDLRGRTDDAGRPLGVTVRALADELAAAADLVKGKTGGIPVAVVRGVREAVPGHDDPAGPVAPPGAAPDATSGARSLNRTDASDWFRRPSLESVWQALGLASDEEPVAAMEPEDAECRIARALSVARAGTLSPGASAELVMAAAPRPGDGDAAPGIPEIRVRAHERTPAGWAAAGALAERVRTALRAEEIAAPLPAVAIRVLGPGVHGIMEG